MIDDKFATSLVAIVIIFAFVTSCMIMGLPNTPKAEHEIIRVCKAPLFRRNKEYIIREQGSEDLYYLSWNNRKTKLDKNARLNDICKKP